MGAQTCLKKHFSPPSPENLICIQKDGMSSKNKVLNTTRGLSLPKKLSHYAYAGEISCGAPDCICDHLPRKVSRSTSKVTRKGPLKS